MEVIEFQAESIKLKDLLKVLNLLPTGGLAKAVIKEEGVILNGQPCYIAGKKLSKGDEIIFDDYKIIITDVD